MHIYSLLKLVNSDEFDLQIIGEAEVIYESINSKLDFSSQPKSLYIDKVIGNSTKILDYRNISSQNILTKSFNYGAVKKKT